MLSAFFKSVASDPSVRRTERRNLSVQVVHEGFEHRATQQSESGVAFKMRAKDS